MARVDGVIGDSNAMIYYYHTDQVGSVKVVTDQSGNMVYNADYMPFGSRFEKDGNFDENHGFTGKEYDSDTELYYYNARWYDSETGRFISEDPAADPNNPNLYSYCTNNPLIFIDPTGKDYWKDGNPVWDWMHNTNHEANAWLESPERWWNQSEGYDKTELLYKRDSGAYFEQWEKQTSQLFGTNIMFGVDPLYEYSKLTDSDHKKYSFKDYVNDMGPIWEAKYKSRTAASVANDLFEVASMIYLASESGNFLKSSAAYLESQGISNSESARERILTNFRKNQLNISDEAFVRFDPKWTTNSILENGIQSKYFSDGKVWFTKYKYIKDIMDPKQLETILYNQKLWPNVTGKFDSGAVLYEMKNIKDPILAGVTNKINGIPQWYIQGDIPRQDLEIVKILSGGN